MYVIDSLACIWEVYVVMRVCFLDDDEKEKNFSFESMNNYYILFHIWRVVGHDDLPEFVLDSGC